MPPRRHAQLPYSSLLVALASLPAATASCSSLACTPAPLSGFIRRQGYGVVDDSGAPFRFVSINVPNLHRLEVNASIGVAEGATSFVVGDLAARVPSEEEVWDALCSLRQMGARATRIYVLAHGSGAAFHVGPGGLLNEAWFKVLDRVLAAANDLGVRLIIPFVNTAWIAVWGATSYYATWANETGGSSEFFYSSAQRALFKAMIERVLTRNSTVTGKLYSQEEAVLAWELGNELHDPKFSQALPPPVEWTQDIAGYIKSLDQNHLVIDGGQFSTAVLNVAAVDIVGSTYYGVDSKAVSDDVNMLAAWNAASDKALQKAFLIKEFGLVTWTAGLPVQDSNWVARVLNIAMSNSVVVGAMYWSLRFHASEGGFYVHREFGGSIRALHWPGFSSGAPNYEIEVFELLQSAAWNVSSAAFPWLANGQLPWTATGQAPCAPQLGPGAAGRACLPFAGSAGAAQYDLWAAPDGSAQDASAWLVVAESVTDYLTEQEAFAAPSASALQTLFPAYSTGVSAFALCLRACSGRGSLRLSEAGYGCAKGGTFLGSVCQGLVPSSCSPCSDPVTVLVDFDASAPKCNATGSFVDYSDLWWQSYYLALSYQGPSAEMLTTIIVLGVLGGLALVELCARPRRQRARSPQEAVSELRGEQGAPRCAVVDLLRLLAVLHILLYLGAKYGWFGELSPAVWNFATWGVVEFPFLFAHAGFVASVRYGAVAADLEVWPFVWRRLARVYPPFFVLSLATVAYATWTAGMPISGKYIFMLPFGIHAWHGDLQFNGIVSEVSWVVGPLLLFAAMALPLCARLQDCSDAALRLMLLAAFGLTAWQAAHYRAIRVFILDDVVTWLALRAFAPAFVMGAALGTLFGRHYAASADGQPWAGLGAPRAVLLCLAERCGVSLGLALCGALWLTVGLGAFGGWPFGREWAGHGLFLPVQCLVLWSAAAGADALAGAALRRGAEHLRRLAPWLWLQALVAPHFAQALADALAGPGQSSGVRVAVFAAVLLALAALGELCLSRPAASWAGRVRPSPEALGLAAAWGPKGRAERLFVYYGGMAAVLLIFAAYALDGGTIWVSIMEVPEGPGSEVLRALTWILYVPAMALGMGLAGMVLFPPVLSPDALPIQLQLQQDRFEGKKPFRLAFRIVTRGNSPMLVHANVRHAHSVLASCLPRDRWILEVANDIPLDLAKLGLPVVELLVPKTYKPPGGCLFKARALQYAVSASAARREDWVIHLDEETRFDADTVAHILTHCREQQAAAASGKQRYAHIGQGVIVYNVTSQVNLLCTLADTIRVSDDFGKFAVQYRLTEQPLIGMHGSFVVCPNSVEMDVGFDYGVAGSITEDTFFAMKAAAAGVHVKWCGGHMFEQSPFGVHDFAKQRCRWFAGLWLCVRDPRLPLLHRIVLGAHVLSWALCPFLTVLAWTNWLFHVPRADAIRASLAVIYGVPLWGYLLGFLWTFSRAKLRHGPSEFVMLLFLQILGVPLYATMEAYGVALALWTRPFSKFELVQKEGPAPGAKTQATGTEAAVAQANSKPQVGVPDKVVELGRPPSCAAAPQRAAAAESPSGPEHHVVPRCTKVAPYIATMGLNEAEGAPYAQSGIPGQVPQADCSAGERPGVDEPRARECLPYLPGRSGRTWKRQSSEPSGGAAGGAPSGPKSTPPAEHWRGVFAGIPSSVEVTRERSRRSSRAPSAEAIRLPDGSAHAMLKVMAASPAGTTLVDVACALLGAVAALLSGAEELVVGVGAAPGEPMVLPVRVAVDWEVPLPQLAGALRQSRVAGEAAHRSGGCPPLAEVFMNGGEGWPARTLPAQRPFQFAVCLAGSSPPSVAEMLLEVVAAESQLVGHGVGDIEPRLWCSAATLPALVVRQWLARLSQVLQAAAEASQTPLRQLPLLSAGEAEQVASLAGRERPFKDETLHDQFLAQAAKTPDAAAAYEGDTCLTYRELALAVRAIAAGVQSALAESLPEQGRDTLVGLLFERSLDALAVLYGVLVAGAGYLPMDPEFPPARIESMLEDAAATCPLVLVESPALAFKLPLSYPGKVARASRAGIFAPHGGALARSIKTAQAWLPKTRDLVYCLYTSGTTGRPKGVMVEHQALSMRIEWFQATFALAPADCVAMKTPYIFGISEWEIFWPLTVGASVAVAPQSTVRSTAALTELLVARGCTHAFFVPSHLKAMLQHWEGLAQPRTALRWVVCCGEVLTEAVVRDFGRVVPAAQLYNLYGPTEGSMTWRHCRREDPSDVAVLIGAPIDNTTVLLLDRWQRPVPVGVPGEVHFGYCVARGYLNQPELTRERFVPNPLPAGFLPAGVPESPVLYRTGDIAVWLQSGELCYIGRADRQVKVRGYRIELGAVEAAMRQALASGVAGQLQQQPSVCCVALPPAEGRPGGELVGFVEGPFDQAALQAVREHLLLQLPAYMVPSRFFAKEAFKTLPSGKTDVRALQAEAAGERAAVTPGSQGQAAEEEETAMVQDSLGVARRLNRGAEHALAQETRVADNLRAFFMYGVIFDHWAGCAEEGSCELVMDAMIWRQSPQLQLGLQNLEVVLRGIGNYKTMSGFLMVSAYTDSGYADAAYFAKGDLVQVLCYVQLLWVCDPIIWAICKGASPDECTGTVNGYAGVHRWYLLVTITIKVSLVLFRMVRLPPLAQCLLVTLLGFVLSPENGCLTDDKCATNPDSFFWKQNYRRIDFFWYAFFRGAAQDADGLYMAVFHRYYVLFMAQYFWTFHYGRKAVAWAAGLLRARAPAAGGWWRALRGAALLLVVFLELLSVGVVGPQLYEYMQEDFQGTLEPQLLAVLLVFALLSAEVALLAFAIAGVPWRLKLLGSTTLGCYMIHFYFSYPVQLVRPQYNSLASMGSGGLALQVLLLLIVPLVFQLTIGAAFHKVLMLEQRAIFAVLDCAQGAVMRACKRKA